MLARLRSRGLLWPTALAVPALAVLIGLGSWQLQRKAWKEDLVARLDARIHAAPITLDQALALWRQTGDVEYVKVRVHGRFQHDKERHLYAPDQKLGPGVHVYTPLTLSDGAILMVNRGFVPERLRDRRARAGGSAQGEQEVVGLLRASGVKESFTPDNDQGRNLWHWRDLTGMLASVSEGGRQPWIPFFLEAAAEPGNPGDWPRGGVTIVKLPNRHFEYALTWFGLALTLIGVYAAFLRARLA